MPTITKNKSQEKEYIIDKNLDKLVEETAKALVDTSFILRDIAINLMIEATPIKIDVIDSYGSNTYKFVTSLPPTRMYIVSGSCDHIKSLNELIGNIRVRVDTGYIAILHTDKPPKDLTHIMVSVNGFHRYTYPPRDYVSYLFFMLNQYIRNEILRLIEEKNLSSNIIQDIIDMELVNEKLNSVNVDIDDLLDLDKLVDHIIVARGEIEFSRDTSKSFNSIESSLYLKNMEEDEIVTITIRDGKDIGIYNMDLGNVYKGLKILLKHFVIREELEFFSIASTKIRDAAIKSYIAVKTLSKI